MEYHFSQKILLMYSVLIMYNNISVLFEIFEIGSCVIAADSTQAAVIW